ncbi:unnamed protein product [Protopolystoma xenopodis]|uniref:Uncharacterized protein n=1 Tax=Protopolystoma xenopodis TaxID=117903 RepID=A0A448WWJ3_9PLAT|nr:unnamed protein product [Protopolystoma xenopodis]
MFGVVRGTLSRSVTRSMGFQTALMAMAIYDISPSARQHGKTPFSAGVMTDERHGHLELVSGACVRE